MDFTIKITEHDIQVLSAALVELPFKVSAPLIDKLNRQIAEQQAPRTAPKPKPEE